LIRQVARRVIALDLDGNPLADLTYKAGEPVPLPDACADLVVSFQVLEHVPVPGDYLREAHRLLRAGGWLLLSTHGVWPYHPHPEDHHRWTHAGLTAEMERAGFVRSEVIPVLPGWAAALQLQLSILLYTWWPQRLYRWTGRILSWCFSWVIEVVERWPGPARELLASVYLVRAMRGEEGVGN
jgi:SAM-dependent methyltransferase